MKVGIIHAYSHETGRLFQDPLPSYFRTGLPLQYWRSTSGFEVDCVVGNALALEFKSSDSVSERHLRGLKALREEGLVRDYAVVSMDPAHRRVDGVSVYPWRRFPDALWAHKIFRPRAT